jgi:zinc protease
MKPLLAALALVLVLAGAGTACGGEAATTPPRIDVHLRVLPNGLKLYSVLDPRSPDVAVQVWYGVGGKDDPPGRSGFAHLFEHLMFKGARDMPSEYVNRISEAMGGDSNASTDNDFTEYEEVVPSGALERLLWAEAERMGGLDVGQADFVAERSVVEDELRQKVFDDPYGRLFEFDIPRASFSVHPYGRALAGSIPELEAATLAEVRAFHAQFYRPDNASLIVVGGFDPARLDAWVDRWFGPIAPPSAPIPQVTAREPQRARPRRVDSFSPKARTPAVALSYAAPPASSPDAAALEVLDAVLTQGDASRLNAGLVERRRLAAQVFSDVELRQQAGLVYVGAVLETDVGMDRAEAMLRAELARLRARPISTRELDRAKNQLLAKRLRDRETVDGVATAIGEAVVTTGDAERVNREIAALQAVTAADVRRVARTWLVDQRRVTIRYHCGAAPARADATPPPQSPSAAVTPAPPAGAAGPAPDVQPDPRQAPSAIPGAPPKPHRPFVRALPNGLQLVVAPSGDLPIATAVLAFRGGSSLDPPGKAGLTDLTASMAADSAGGRSPSDFAAAVEGLGDTLTTDTGRDAFSFTLKGLSASLPQGLDLLADVAMRPGLDARGLARARLDALEDAEDAARAPDSIAELIAPSLVFGRGPWGRASSGVAGSLERIRRADVVRQHARLYRPDNAVLVLTGDVAPAKAFAMARRAFGRWRRPAGASPAAAAAGPAPKGRTLVVDLPGAEEAVVMVAGRAVGRRDPGYWGAAAAAGVLGGGYASRLNDAIRIRRGLSYDAQGSLEALGDSGLFSASAETSPPRAAEVAALMADQLNALRTTPPPPDELAARKAALIGRFARATRTSDTLATLLAQAAVHGVAPAELIRYPERLATVTPGEVRAAARRLADPGRLNLIVVGDANVLLPAMKARFGAVDVIRADRLERSLSGTG